MQRKTIVMIAIPVLLTALVSLWCTVRTSPPPVPRNLFSSLGQGLAQEAAAAAGDQGQIVAVIAEDHQQSGTLRNAEWQVFTGEIKKHTSFQLAEPEITTPGNHFPLMEIFDRHPRARVLVFFADPPDLRDWNSIANRSTFPKIVAVGNPDLIARGHYAQAFNKGILAALIFPRSTAADVPSSPPKSPREWFDQYYQVFTPQNFDTLPE